VLGSLSDSSPAASTIQSGTVYVGIAPAGHFLLTVDGRSVRQQPAFGWAAQYVTAKGHAELSLSQFPLVPLAVMAEVVVWVVLVAALVGRRRARSPPGPSERVVSPAQHGRAAHNSDRRWPVLILVGAVILIVGGRGRHQGVFPPRRARRRCPLRS